MSIEQVVSNAVVEKDGIHFLSEHAKFGYNDGDRIESYILNVIRNAKDISSDSRELETHIRDWPSLYHFSRERSLAYQSLNITRDMRVLEVGCGCGSITRLLGERSDHVVALEGSPRRATITRARTRDLNSVTVLCASFEDVKFTQQFDLVICNGVLEYASLFVKHKDPHRRMIELLSALVAPGGSLVVAIENKFGLRYFGSSKEEHTNVMYDSIEGYPGRPSGPRTFGMKDLEELFKGLFSVTEVLLPLPDYKLPTALIRQSLVGKVQCSELFANTARQDLGAQVRPSFHERLAWQELAAGSVLHNFSNSFFVIASHGTSNLLSQNWLGDIYSILRRPEFCTRTTILVDENGDVVINKVGKYLAVPANENTSVIHHTGYAHWVNGPSVHTDMVRALMINKAIKYEARLRDIVNRWWDSVVGAGFANNRLKGNVIDMHWQNAINSGDGVVFIDREWELPETVSIEWFLFRVANRFIECEVPYFHRWHSSCRGLSAYKLAMVIAHITKAPVTMLGFLRAAKDEERFQYAVAGRRYPAYRLFAAFFEPVRIRYLRRGIGAAKKRVADIARRIF